MKNQGPRRFTFDFMLEKNIIVNVEIRKDCLKFFVLFFVIRNRVNIVITIIIAARNLYEVIMFVKDEIISRIRWKPISVFARSFVRLFCFKLIDAVIWWYSSMWSGNGFDK